MKKYIKILLVLVMLFCFGKVAVAETIEEMIEKGEVTLKSVPITDEDSFWMYTEKFSMEHSGYYFDHDSCNADYTSCDLHYQGSKVATVKLKYSYDPAVKKVVDEIMKKVPAGGKVFTLNDIETVRYYLALVNYESSDEEDSLNPIVFSSEYKKFIGYKNFIYEPRMGYDEMFASFNGGTATFEYDDTIDGLGIKVNAILYVDDDETDIAGALKTRLSKYFDITNVTKDEETTVHGMFNDMLDYERSNYNSCKADIASLEAVPNDERDSEWYNRNSDVNSRCYFVNWYDTADEYVESYREDMLEYGWDFIDQVEENIYVLDFADDLIMGFWVIKDSSKVYDEDIEVVTSDSSSGVTISTDSEIPLDTLIQVARITDGEEYNKIVKILKITNGEMFDLKLFSKSMGDYITKLDDGKFEVKIPISDALKGKDLIVYYVNDKDEVEEYKVTVKDGYAVFNTNHFSVYTLAENPNPTTDTAVVTNNPTTFDSVIIYVAILLISLVCVVVGVIYLKKELVKKY